MYGKNKPAGAMPSHYFPHDKKWIEEKLAILNIVERARVCAAYSHVYLTTLEAEPSEIKKENAARRAANERLRVFIDKKTRVFG
jgi:hypothetical protein